MRLVPTISRTASTRVMVPEWLALECAREMQVYDAILATTAFLGMPTERGFVVDGTGFFVAYTQDGFDFAYLVTARHVVWPERQRGTSPPDRNVHIRVNRKSGPPLAEKSALKDWFFADHGIDLAVFPCGINVFDVNHNVDTEVAFLKLPEMALTDQQADEFHVALGDEVFIAGAFVNHIGEKRNIPIIRMGNIAAFPSEPIAFVSPTRGAYLVETRSLGGISGSPVFFPIPENGRKPVRKGPDRAPIRMTPGNWPDRRHPSFVMPYTLIGMVLGFYSGGYETDRTGNETDEKDIIPTKDADLNSGISVVLPIHVILEFLESPAVAKARTDHIEEARKASGYRPASARTKAKAQAEQEDANPHGKEDFMSLLNAAATKKSQGG